MKTFENYQFKVKHSNLNNLAKFPFVNYNHFNNSKTMGTYIDEYGAKDELYEYIKNTYGVDFEIDYEDDSKYHLEIYSKDIDVKTFLGLCGESEYKHAILYLRIGVDSNAKPRTFSCESEVFGFYSLGRGNSRCHQLFRNLLYDTEDGWMPEEEFEKKYDN